MPTIAEARAYLRRKLDETRSKHGVPGLTAVLVRDAGDTVVTAVSGVRKWDVAHSAPTNSISPSDPFNIGSVSKPFTGYLISTLVQKNQLQWNTTIGQVFPEFTALAFRTRYGIHAGYLGRTIEQLMTHHAGFPYAPKHGYEMIFNNWNGELRKEYETEETEMLRRYNYVITSMQDPEETMPGPNVVYGGGTITCAAMAERLTGVNYRTLMQQHVFGKLGMTRSGFGRLATSPAPDGVWQHAYNKDTGTITPDQWTTTTTWGYNCHAPAGSVHTTAEDLGRFITANLPESGKPKVGVSDATLLQAQEKPFAAESGFTRGGWALHASGDARYVEHNGDNGLSYAHLRIQPGRNYGLGAMCNVSGDIGHAAVNELVNMLENMHANWNTIA